MENDAYKPRIVDAEIELKLKMSKAVCIQGPKACGKTWAAEHQAASEIKLGDASENFANRRIAMMDNSFALKGEKPHLIDEWQEIPSLWYAVRAEVDKVSEKGQFILTGSSTPVQKGIMHSGTGRISLLTMKPMSLYESGESSGKISLSSLFKGNLSDGMHAENPGIEKLAYYIVR